MLWIGTKRVAKIWIGSKPVAVLYRGAVKIWEAITHCIAGGWWQHGYGWQHGIGWKQKR